MVASSDAVSAGEDAGLFLEEWIDVLGRRRILFVCKMRRIW